MPLPTGDTDVMSLGCLASTPLTKFCVTWYPFI